MDTTILIVILSAAAPIIGSFIGVIRKPSEGFMYIMLSFAAGVMLAISFLELIPESIELSSELTCISGLAVGSLVMHAIDRLIPHSHPDLCCDINGKDLKRTAVYLILGIFLHNFPEGMALALVRYRYQGKLCNSSRHSHSQHTRGICTSAPYYHCTGDRMKSFGFHLQPPFQSCLGLPVHITCSQTSA